MPGISKVPAAASTSGQRQRIADRPSPRQESAGDRRDHRHEREAADDQRRRDRVEAALDQMRRLMQADPGLHRVDHHRIEHQQPEGGGAHRLPAREGRLGGAARRLLRAAERRELRCRAAGPCPPAGAPGTARPGQNPRSRSPCRARPSRRASRHAIWRTARSAAMPRGRAPARRWRSRTRASAARETSCSARRRCRDRTVPPSSSARCRTAGRRPSRDGVSDSNSKAAPLTRTARHNTSREPRRSSMGPISGETSAANRPPSETAPDRAVRDQPNSCVSGSTKIDKVATAGPCRAKPAQHKHARTTQP